MEQTPFERFMAKMVRKSERTKQTYIDVITQFRKANFIDSYELLLEGTIGELSQRIREYLPTKTHSTANKTFWALRTFYAANGIKLDWDDDLKDYVPLRKPVIQYRARTKQEVEAILQVSKPREQLATLTMAAGGPRVGALPTLFIENAVWIEKYGLYCLKAYPGTNDEYLFFITPQASELMKKCIGKRTNGAIFMSKFDGDWPADENTLAQAIRRASIKARVYLPREVQIDHGFRHFFRTTLETSKIHDDFAERLMGHKKEKLKKVYSHPDPLELLEASEYHKAIPNLTFDMN